jgi:hybrid cluster-associated redox disulfide protein
MDKITKDTLIGDLLKLNKREELAEILLASGMHCLGCAIAKHETVAQAAEVHGIDADELLSSLNAVLE